jgi:uncharacterized pyridoxal phosphate-containing UPF0001 family protein
MTDVPIAERYRSVVERVARAAEAAGRDPDEITVVAVAKTFSAAVVAEAIDAGVTDVGESRAQELREKVAALGRRLPLGYAAACRAIPSCPIIVSRSK